MVVSGSLVVVLVCRRCPHWIAAVPFLGTVEEIEKPPLGFPFRARCYFLSEQRFVVRGLLAIWLCSWTV